MAKKKARSSATSPEARKRRPKTEIRWDPESERLLRERLQSPEGKRLLRELMRILARAAVDRMLRDSDPHGAPKVEA